MSKGYSHAVTIYFLNEKDLHFGNNLDLTETTLSFGKNGKSRCRKSSYFVETFA
jgi:hypothetical protein